MPSSQAITLVVGSSAWRNWTSYEVAAQFETPADSWRIEVRAPSSAQLAQLQLGAVVILMVERSTVLRGRLDRRELRRTTKGGTVVVLSGRDLAGQLVDCTTPTSWAWRNISLAGLAAKAVSELGLAVTVDAHSDAQVVLPWVKAEQGETYWQVLERYARKARLMPWMSPAGALRIGRPDYTSTPVASLINAISPAKKNQTNVLEALFVDDITQRFSSVTVLGQSKGSDSMFGGNAAHLRGEAVDADLAALGVARPLVMDDGDLRSSREARDRAEWEVSHRIYQGRSLEYVVAGHGPTPSSTWRLDTMVNVYDELAAIEGPWWVAGYRLLRDGSAGSRTALTLRPPNALLPPAVS